MSIYQHDFTLVRGDDFTHRTMLSTGWEDVIENPLTYTGRFVFREDQDDSLTDLHVATSPVEIVNDPRFGGDCALFTFSLTPAETQALPAYDIVSYVEITDGADYVRRGYNSKVKIRD